MICVEVGHLYVGDDPESLGPAVAAYQERFSGGPAIIMIDDYSRPCEDAEIYEAAVSAYFSTRGISVRTIFESALVPAAEVLFARLTAQIAPQRFRGKTVHFFEATGIRVKVAETLDAGEVRFSCPALVAALTLTRVEAWGATKIVSILPETYRDNEKAADALTAAFGMRRELLFV